MNLFLLILHIIAQAVRKGSVVEATELFEGMTKSLLNRIYIPLCLSLY